MHLPDNILPAPVVVAGWLAAAGGVGVGLAKLRNDDIPKAGLLAAVFFVATLIAIPIPPSTAHPLLSGLMGLTLGWAAFPAILAALLLQVVQFGHGGYSTLGVNTFVMALPAVTVYYIFGCRKLLGRNFFSRFAAGALAVVMACALQASVLYLSDDKFIAPIIALLTGHVPVMIIDGLLTAWALAFLIKVRPESLCFEIEQVPGDA